MVVLISTLFSKSKPKIRKYLTSGFRDSLRVFVSGGGGGNGLPKFGGVGGNGGDVVAVAKENITLDHVYKLNKSKRYIAKNGRHSTHNFIVGVPGEPLKFDVPVGVSFYTDLGKHLGDLNKEGEEIVLAIGGNGGHPKNGFLGTKGQSYPLTLDLKLIADIGLVGFPNAGKSTFLGAISHAKPKVASYPFTTVKPNVGIVEYKDLRQISVADLPGLIEGAHANKGMGHKFLKHVERTRLILMIVDINGFQLSHQYPHRSCLDTILLLTKELQMYNEDLLYKPAMLLINKMDTEDASTKYNEIKPYFKNLNEHATNLPEEMRPTKFVNFNNILPISAKESSQDILMVKQKIRNLLDSLYDMENEDLDNTTDLYQDTKKKLVERRPLLV